MDNIGNLFLIPAPISENTNEIVIPPHVRNRLADIRHFLVENVRTARRYLGSLKVYPSIEILSFSLLTKDTGEEEMASLFAPLRAGLNLGVLSEAGCPGVADPGAIAANYAHRNGIRVIPLVGPSAILLALMASGLNGQQFAFHGYLPIQSSPVSKAIKELEKESRAKGQTQIFIETPYRNKSLLDNLIKMLSADTWLSVASDITGENELIVTRQVKDWRVKSHDFKRVPTVFLFLAR